MDSNSNYALAEALKQAGVNLKAAVYATGYEPDVINSPAWSALQGGYFLSLFRPWLIPNAGTQQMQAAMEKYADFKKTDFPSFSQYEAWAGADLMIKGLERAGPNPTHASVIHALRSIKSYNANGLLPQSFNYSTNFGHNPAQSARGSSRPPRPASRWRHHSRSAGRTFPAPRPPTRLRRDRREPGAGADGGFPAPGERTHSGPAPQRTAHPVGVDGHAIFCSGRIMFYLTGNP